jgi:hypothetical protein
MQIVEQAIESSKKRNNIAHIDAIDMRQASVSAEAVCEELFAECEDDAENGSVREFWGEDIDGNEWRVHVEVD